jgi:hypothetical protein
VKSIFVKTVPFLLMAVCFLPEVAEARLIGSGASNAPGVDATFDINTLIEELNSTKSDETIGVFDNVVQLNLRNIRDPELNFDTSPVGSNINLNSGRLTVSEIDPSNLALFDALINDGISPTPEFSGDGVQYQASFASSPIQLTFFVPGSNSSTPSKTNLINSLKSLEFYISNNPGKSFQGFITNIPNPSPGKLPFTQRFGLKSGIFPLSLNVTKDPISVPEPDITVSLLGAATLGGFLRIKRNQRSKTLSCKTANISQ